MTICIFYIDSIFGRCKAMILFYVGMCDCIYNAGKMALYSQTELHL